MRRRHLSRIGLGAVALAVAAAVWFRASSHHEAEATTTPTRTEDGARLALGPAALAKNPIAVAKATLAPLAGDLFLVGSVAYDQSRYAVVGPLVAGRVVTVRAGLGDVVKKGQLLAEIESAEVGQAQAAWLSATAREKAAEANARRERELAAQHVSSAREEEVAQATALSESAEARAATERLRAFGLSPGDLAQLQRGGTGGRVPLRAPIDGTVVSRAIALGQAVERGTDAFQIVDLSRLWVLLDVHEKDLGRVHVGQKVELTTESGAGVLHAEVGYVSPIVDDKTRTAHVRIGFDNRAGTLRPGQYVTARLVGDPAHATGKVLVVPRRCVQRVEGKLVVFVRAKDGRFERRTVDTGAAAGDFVEVRAGLTEGDEVAADGAFLLKSELLR